MTRLFLLALLSFSLACGDDDSPVDGGPDARTDTGTDSGVAMDTGGILDTGVLLDTGMPLDSGADVGFVACGGFGGSACAATEYCDFPDNRCGAADGSGVCRPRPATCPDLVDPRCACDGMIYGNGCEAAAAGQDTNDLGGCTPPEGRFECGSLTCTTSEYCTVVTDDTGMANTYSCAMLPAACSDDAACACVASVPCGDLCDADEDGNLTVTCPGG